MKVLMFNGSRRTNGNTYEALNIMEEVLKKENVESEIISIAPYILSNELNDLLKLAKEKCAEADAFVFGSPVYYASASGEMILFMDHLFAGCRNELHFKPAALLSVARRAGNCSCLDVLVKYPLINEMPIVSSSYWPMVFGEKTGEIYEDKEGIFVLESLASNLVWLLKSISIAKENGIYPKDHGKKPITNFIR